MSSTAFDTSAPLVIFGCGYTGRHLARAALADGQRVRACSRSPARLQPVVDLGAEIRVVDATKSKQFGPATSAPRVRRS